MYYIYVEFIRMKTKTKKAIYKQTFQMCELMHILRSIFFVIVSFFFLVLILRFSLTHIK